MVARDTIVVANAPEAFPIRLAEEMRLVSEEAGGLLLGDLTALAVLSDGRFVSWDAYLHELRLHSPGGEFLRLLGGEGEGPGEFERVHGLSVTDDDQIVVWDGGNNRITVLEPTGDVVFTRRADVAVNDGAYFAIVSDSAVSLRDTDASRVAASGSAMRLVLHSFVDTSDEGLMLLPLKRSSHTGFAIGRYINFPVQTVSDIGRGGRVAMGRGDAYTIDYLIGDTLLRISRDATSVEVLQEEREDWLRALGRFERMTGEEFPVPLSKPFFRGLMVGDQGRLWVERYVAGIRLEEGDCFGSSPLCWVEPVTFDVFGLDGHYDGTVVLPSVHSSLLRVDGAEIWVAERGRLDDQELVKYRLLDG